MGKKVTTKELHKELDLIQGCITRMADNSFKVKEGYIALVTVASTVLLSWGCEIEKAGIFLLVVTSIFWGLDAFFLKMETLYRWKYEWVIEYRKEGEVNYLYDLNPHNQGMWQDADKKKTSFNYFVFSKTLIPLYTTVFVISFILLLIASM